MARRATPVAALRPSDIEETPAGPGLALLLDSLDLEALDEATLVEVVAAWQRQVALGELRAAQAAAELSRREPMNPDWRCGAPNDPCVAADELAMRLGWSRRATQRLVKDGLALDGGLAAVGDAVEAGTVDGPRMRALLDALRDEPYQVAWPVLAAVLPRAASRSVRQLRDDVERAVLAVCPDETQRRHEQAFAGRHVDHPKRLPRGTRAPWTSCAPTRSSGASSAVRRTRRATRWCSARPAMRRTRRLVVSRRREQASSPRGSAVRRRYWWPKTRPETATRPRNPGGSTTSIARWPRSGWRP